MKQKALNKERKSRTSFEPRKRSFKRGSSNLGEAAFHANVAELQEFKKAETDPDAMGETKD